jgi:hypothetical protein
LFRRSGFNGGQTETGTRWAAGAECALEGYLRGGGSMVAFHASSARRLIKALPDLRQPLL